MTLKKKLMLLPVISLVGLGALQALNVFIAGQIEEKVIFPRLRESVLEGHIRSVRATVDVAAEQLGQVTRAHQTRADQEAAIIAATDPVRFFADSSGYLFTYDTTGVRINVPINKSGNGKNQIAQRDANGVPFIEELIRAAQRGGDFVRYHFEKEGKGIQPKLAYAKMIPGTDILVGTGVYTDDVDAEIESMRAELSAKTREFVKWTVACVVTIMALAFGLGGWIATTTQRAILAIVDRLTEAAIQTRASADQLSSTGQEMASGASEQAASLEETSASLEEMAGMTRHNAENAAKVNELGRQTRSAAEKGSSDMAEMIRAMDTIKASSDEISNIIKTIDEISFQTNILALNAAVEAARAGEAGLGFAVVSEEVRNLAQRSARAAQDTSAKIQSAIARTVEGVTISRAAATGLADIVSKARQVDELAAQVATASREQSTGIDQVNKAVGQIDTVTQSNAAAAEESAAAAADLGRQAALLEEAVAHLSVLVGARPRHVAPVVTLAQESPVRHRPQEFPVRLSPRRRVLATSRH